MPGTGARVRLLWIVLAALAVRLVVMGWLYSGPRRAVLQQFAFPSEMANVARSLATGQGFSSPFGIPTGPTAIVAPVYPGLLAAIFRIFGVDTEASAVASLTLNSLFSALTCLPIFFLARDSLSQRVAIATGWVWAFFPNAMFVPVNWLWETSLATLLLGVLVLLAMRLEKSPRMSGWLAFGALWSLLALTSPALLAALPFVAAWLGYRLRRRGARWLWPAAASALVFLVCVTPWFARNGRAFSRFIPFRSGFGLELRVGNSLETGVIWRGWLHPHENPAEARRYQQMGEVAYMAEKRREALAFIAAHPGTFAWLTAKRIAYIWTSIWDLSPGYLRANPLDAVNIPITTSLTILALVGLRLAFRERNPAAWLFALTILAVPLVYYFTHVNIRYRHPLDPFLVILAALAVTRPFAGHAQAGAEGPTDPRLNGAKASC